MLNSRAPRVSWKRAGLLGGLDRGELLLDTCSVCAQVNWFPRHFCVRSDHPLMNGSLRPELYRRVIHDRPSAHERELRR